MAKQYVSDMGRQNIQIGVVSKVIFPYTTGKTIASIDVAKDGAQFADGTSTCAEIDDKASSGSGLYLLTVSAADASAAGPLGFELNDGTDEIYLSNIFVVNHDPEQIAEPGDEMALEDDAVTSAKLAATATAEIADAVLLELVADHDGTAGSLAELVREIRQRLCGKRVWDESAGEYKIYDTDNSTVLVTETHTDDSPATGDVTVTSA